MFSWTHNYRSIMKNIWNWIKNLFIPEKKPLVVEDVVSQKELPIINEVEETAKQKKIRLKYSGGLK